MAQINGAANEPVDYEAIVVGAGFGGVRMMHELQKQGISFKVLEEGTGIGGTWYWNRYPGARTDSESWIYIVNFSKELNDEWVWSERYPTQTEVEKYLNHVVDRFDMRKHIQFRTRVTSARLDDTKAVWNITLANGEVLRCKYFISATGVLSVGRELPFPGVTSFRGEYYMSYAWPKHDIDFSGKRIAVIGTGATSVQIIPLVAHTAKSLTVFQRTPNFVLPARNHPLTADQQKEIKTNYDQIWHGARTQMFGMPIVDSKLTAKGAKNDAATNRVLEAGWETGGFRFIFETYADMLTDHDSNRIASEFVKNKIRAIVKDDETAELLCPDHPIMAKRPPLGHQYYQTFNKEHVTLVDVKNNAIKTITKSGVRLDHEDPRTKQQDFDFDMIIYAVGFDVSTGPLTRLEVRGKETRTLGEHWKESLDTYLGICVENYPNMFMISGPQSPFANVPVVVDNTCDWIGKSIRYMRENGYGQMEPKREAMDKYVKLLSDAFSMTVLPEAAKSAGSWFVGANIPGKKMVPLLWFGGVPPYFAMCDAEIDSGFASFRMH